MRKQLAQSEKMKADRLGADESGMAEKSHGIGRTKRSKRFPNFLQILGLSWGLLGSKLPIEGGNAAWEKAAAGGT